VGGPPQGTGAGSSEIRARLVGAELAPENPQASPRLARATKRRTQRTKKVRHRHGSGSSSYTIALLPDELEAVEKAAEKALEDRVARAEADRDEKAAYLAQPGQVVREVKAKHGTLRFVLRKVQRG
jgi:hypothetical protein